MNFEFALIITMHMYKNHKYICGLRRNSNLTRTSCGDKLTVCLFNKKYDLNLLCVRKLFFVQKRTQKTQNIIL